MASDRSGRERLSSGAVVVMLALGIGANVAIFTLLNAIWLRPLAYRDADRLVTVEDSFTRLGIRSASRGCRRRAAPSGSTPCAPSKLTSLA